MKTFTQCLMLVLCVAANGLEADPRLATTTGEPKSRGAQSLPIWRVFHQNPWAELQQMMNTLRAFQPFQANHRALPQLEGGTTGSLSDLAEPGALELARAVTTPFGLSNVRVDVREV